jgi:hypothetical protein
LVNSWVFCYFSLMADAAGRSELAEPLSNMDESYTVEKLTEEIRDVALQVNAAAERAEERDFVSATHAAVERVAQRYRELFARLPEGEKLKVERSLGRRLSDVKRLASLLPKVGSLSTSTPDRQVTGASEVGERRITGVSWGAGSRMASGAAGRYKVGGDVEAWCSPCGTMTEHSIVAIVGDEPKQVVCQACNARHGYRTTPARKGTPETGPAAPARTLTGAEREAQKRADQKAAELRALATELAETTEVRTFDPKGRYRAGEVISHPEYGRGKIETVLRSSLLVRFSVGGLKSLMLY